MTKTGTTTRSITFGNTQVAVTLPAGTIVSFRPAAVTNGVVYTTVVGRRLSEVLPITLITSP